MDALLVAARSSRMPLTHAGWMGRKTHGFPTATNPPAAVRGIFISAGLQPQTGVTGRFQELRYILTCSESRPYTGKPGESRVARLSARVETWKPLVNGQEPALRLAATITREPSIAHGLSRLPVHRRACLMPEFPVEGH